MSKRSDYQTGGKATGHARRRDGPLTNVKVQDSGYGGEPSIRNMTQKSIEVDGVEYPEFYTSRKASLDTFSNPQLRQDLDNTQLGHVNCNPTKAKGGGKDYWV